MLTDQKRFERSTEERKNSHALMRRISLMLWHTRSVAVAVSARIGTSGNCCFSTPSFL